LNLNRIKKPTDKDNGDRRSRRKNQRLHCLLDVIKDATCYYDQNIVGGVFASVGGILSQSEIAGFY
jgi:hypothetical protein